MSGAGVLRITFCVTPVTKDYFNASKSPNELWFHNAEFYYYFIPYYNRILLLFSFNLMLSQ